MSFRSLAAIVAGANSEYAVAGGRGYKSTYMLDGGNIQNIRMASAQVDIDPPVEVISACVRPTRRTLDKGSRNGVIRSDPCG